MSIFEGYGAFNVNSSNHLVTLDLFLFGVLLCNTRGWGWGQMIILPVML